MTVGWAIALAFGIVLSVVATLWMALLLVRQAVGDVAENIVRLVQSLLGTDQPDDGLVWENEIGATTDLFATVPFWERFDVEHPETPDYRSEEGGGMA